MKKFTKQFRPLELPIHGVRLPAFFIEKEHKRKNGLSEDVDNFDFLRGICINGFKKLKLKKNSKQYKEYTDRAKHELDILKELDLIKSDKKMTKKMKTLSEKNVDIVASAAKLRKAYEDTYRELREIVYPKSKGMRKK